MEPTVMNIPHRYNMSNSKDRMEPIVMNIPHRYSVFHLVAERHAILPKPNCVLPLAGTVMSLQRFLQSIND